MPEFCEVHPEAWVPCPYCPWPSDRDAEPTPGAAVGAAWDDVLAHIPEGWLMRYLTFVPPTSKRAARRGPHWRAQACRRTDLGLGNAGMTGIGTTADAALTRLAGLLEGVRA